MDRVLAIAQSPVYSRKRRQVNNPTPTHASMLSATSTFDILDTGSSESVDTTRSEIVHDSFVTTTSSAHDDTTILHDATEVSVVSDSPLSTSVLFAVSDTNIPSELTNAPSTSPPTEVPQTSEDATIAYTTTSKTPDPDSTSSVSIDVPITASTTISTDKPSTITTKSYEDFITKQESIDVKSSTKSEKLTSPIDDVLKITGDIPQDIPVEVEEPGVEKSKLLHESNSMKPSSVESPDAIQHDYPVYSYGHDEVEIVNLNPEFALTTNKTKDVNQKKSPDKNLLDNDVKNRSLKEETIAENKTVVEDTSAELETLINLPHTKKVSDAIDSEPIETKVRINTHGFDEFTEPNSSLSVTSKRNSDSNNPNIHSSATNVQVVNIPSTDTSRHAKRVFVNVTIAAEPDAEHPNRNQPFYVLSVSVPTDGNPNSFPGINIGNINPVRSDSMYLESSSTNIPSTELTSSTSLSSKNPNTPTPLVQTHRPYHFWGGECKCSCPCLDEETTSTTVASTFDSLLIEAGNYSTPSSSAIANSSASDDLLLDSSSDSHNSTDDYFSSTSETTIDDVYSSSSTTQANEGWSSTDVSACPEVSTALPPPPTILILEGREKS